MSTENLIATAETGIHAPVYKVWETLTDPESNTKFMFGSKVESDWKEGSTITWSGTWNGHPYVDKGKILRMVPGKLLQYTHYSPVMNNNDSPENYRTVTIELSDSNDQTLVSLKQDKNKTEDDRAEAEKNWRMMLDSLRELIEEKEE